MVAAITALLEGHEDLMQKWLALDIGNGEDITEKNYLFHKDTTDG